MKDKVRRCDECSMCHGDLILAGTKYNYGGGVSNMGTLRYDGAYCNLCQAKYQFNMDPHAALGINILPIPF